MSKEYRHRYQISTDKNNDQGRECHDVVSIQSPQVLFDSDPDSYSS